MVTKRKIKEVVKIILGKELDGIRCNIICQNVDREIRLTDKDWWYCEEVCDDIIVKLTKKV